MVLSALAFCIPAVGQPIPRPISTASSVAAVYETYHVQPIWFRNGPDGAAIAKLTAILQRAPFDGFAEGPQLAAAVQAAVAQSTSGKPEDVQAGERILSSAWLQYVQAIRKPTTGMIYAYSILKPRGSNADQVLLTTAAAPSLEAYLESVANVNVLYAQLRDSAWAEAQASGNLIPDPRLLANLDRLRSLPATGRFLLVDSGSSMLTLYDNGQVVDSMKVITGTKDLPTPLIASIMYYITYNPYWHAPDHLVRKTIAPTYHRQGQRYFTSHGYHVLDDWGDKANVIDPTTVDWKGAAFGTVHLRVVQDPGPLNSMGKLKFPFANPEDIYLHDTPSRDLFNKAQRNLSNGCVRVEDAERLGRWLLGEDPVSPGSEAELQVKASTGLPIYLTYITAQVQDGKIAYLPDLYGWDSAPPQFASN